MAPLERGAAGSSLAAHRLRRRCDLSAAGFATTADLQEPDGIYGQERAIEAIRFGIGMRAEGYNLFAMGPDGHGRHTTVRRLLAERAATDAIPADWCYVFNFATPHKPAMLSVPPGRALQLQEDMRRLVEDLQVGIPAAFETDEYRARRQEIETEFNEHQEGAVNAVGEKAREQGIALLRTPSGFAFAPRHGDAVMEPERFRALPEAEQNRIESTIAALQAELEKVIESVPKWRREAQHKLRDLNRQVTGTAVSSLIKELTVKWKDVPAVGAHLARVQEDVLDHAEFFRQPKEGEPPTLFGIPIARTEPGETPLRRYQVNVLVEHAQSQGAPVVYEDHPNYGNLIGRIEHIAQMGTLLTDFTLIKPGALHRANGGYLVLDALKVLLQPFAWDMLKRALRSRELRIETPAQSYGLISTVSLEPESIPLDVKVVLVGERLFYYLMHAYDPEFRELFKVAGDFEEDTERAAGAEIAHARAIATLVRNEKLRPLERAAVERVIEHAARQAGDAERLSLHMRGLVDLLRETDYWAQAGGHDPATAADVEAALAAREHRLDRMRQRIRDEMLRGTLMVSTQGERAGQVNGLSVVELGGFAFGMPHRITARVRLGGGKVVDIERETELGGPIHSKGVLILSGFLAGRYAVRHPLSLSASLVFEQSYSGVEGDSASCAELYALLSALADAPLAQSLAVTGSVNQHGDVQAIGGVNEKIEGFFDLCAARGLDGRQGVLIPGANVKHLMLQQRVVDAVAAGRFQIYAVDHVDQGIEILTGLPADRVNRRVEERLLDFAQRARTAGAPERKKEWRSRATAK
jgi:lon-related putative ATP-dependent protease